MDAHKVRIHAINLDKSAHWNAEASQLGLPPGRWPDKLVLDCEDGCPPITMLRDCQQYTSTGELAGMTYKTPANQGRRTTLMVFND